MGWNHRVKLLHLFTEDEDYDSVQKSMNQIADEIKKHDCFAGFDVNRFHSIPESNGIFEPVDFANKLLSGLYDCADARRIWIA